MTLLIDAMTAYLGPLLKKHNSGECLIWEDLVASHVAAMSKSKDNVFVSKRVEDLHQSQVQAYREAALRALREWAQSQSTFPLEPMQETDTEQSFVERCVDALKSNPPPNWKLDNAKMVVTMEIRKRARTTFAKYHPHQEQEPPAPQPVAVVQPVVVAEKEKEKKTKKATITTTTTATSSTTHTDQHRNDKKSAGGDNDDDNDEDDDDDGEMEEDGELEDDDGEVEEGEEDGQQQPQQKSAEPTGPKKGGGGSNNNNNSNSKAKKKKKATPRKKGTASKQPPPGIRSSRGRSRRGGRASGNTKS